MKSSLLAPLLILFSYFHSPALAAATWPKERPKLIVIIAIDQFRADYLSRFKDKFTDGGFAALIDNGAYFPYGEFDILQSMTGPGHATILTGAYPYQMGIPLNEWADVNTGQKIYCTEDKAATLVGAATGANAGTSPRNLLGTTVGDELKNIDLPSKVIALALKDRAAILMGGHRADLAFWFDADSRRWISSNYYLKNAALPAWMNDLNTEVAKTKCDLSTTCGIDLTAQAFRKALVAYSIGQGKGPDLMAVSFSSHDYAGHKFGPNAKEMEEMTLAEDRAIANMRAMIEHTIPGGLKSTLIVLTGDHGISPTPGYLRETGVDAGFIDSQKLQDALEKSMSRRFGNKKKSNWITFVTDFNFFLDEPAIARAKIELADVEAFLKSELLKNSGFAQVFLQSDFQKGLMPPGMFGRQLGKTFYPGRSGRVIALPKPFYITAEKPANHMTGYTYDRTVPILFSGVGIKKGIYADHAEVVDIAPTLSFILGILPPALNEGKVLKSALIE